MLGDIGVGATAQLFVPFAISQSSAGSIQAVTVQFYYSYSSGSASYTKTTSLSIPIIVKQYKPLSVILADSSIVTSPGERITLSLNITNIGGAINNLVVGTPANSSFALYGAVEKAIGDILPNSTKQVKLELASNSDAKTGTYSIPLTFTYQDALKQPTVETYYLGPITVLESSAKYRLSLKPLETVKIGMQVPFELIVENAGTTPMSGSILINSTSAFTLIGMQTVYFDDVAPGKSASKTIPIGVSSSISPGYYTLPLLLSTAEGQKVEYVAGIVVDATPQITISFDASGTIPQVQIANTGNSQIRSVHATVNAGAGKPIESFIGTLNVDDYSSVSLPDLQSRTVNVFVTFKDINNVEHEVNKTIEIGGMLPFAQASTSSAQTAQARGAQQRNPLGFLFGGRQAPSQNSGIGLIELAAVAVLAILAFFAYRHFKKGKQVGQK
jgi:uncharacterized membrane protein